MFRDYRSRFSTPSVSPKRDRKPRRDIAGGSHAQESGEGLSSYEYLVAPESHFRSTGRTREGQQYARAQRHYPTRDTRWEGQNLHAPKSMHRPASEPRRPPSTVDRVHNDSNGLYDRYEHMRLSSTRRGRPDIGTTRSAGRRTSETCQDHGDHPMSYASGRTSVWTYKEAAEAMISTIRDKRTRESPTALEELVEEMYNDALASETNGEQVNWKQEARDIALYTGQILHEVDL